MQVDLEPTQLFIKLFIRLDFQQFVMLLFKSFIMLIDFIIILILEVAIHSFLVGALQLFFHYLEYLQAFFKLLAVEPKVSFQLLLGFLYQQKQTFILFNLPKFIFFIRLQFSILYDFLQHFSFTKIIFYQYLRC